MMFLHVAHDLRERQICFFPVYISALKGSSYARAMCLPLVQSSIVSH